MADLTLRLCGGNFIDVAPPTLIDHAVPMKRGASAPPCTGRQGVHSDQDQALIQARHYYLASLWPRAGRLGHASCGTGGFGCRPKNVSTSTDVPGPAPGTNMQFKFQDNDATPTNAVPQSITEPASTTGTQFEFKDDYATRPTPTNAVGKPITTLMLCDLPCSLGPQEILDEIDKRGFSDAYDMFYMPPPRRQKRTTQRNLGYAFLNLKTPEHATAFAIAFKTFVFPNRFSMKKSYTTPANKQGFKANFKNSVKEPFFISRRQ